MSWSTAPTAPERQTGVGWFPDGAEPPRAVGPGWHALLEKVGPHTGNGSLTVTAAPRKTVQVFFSGSGTTLPALTLRNWRTCPLSGDGLPTGTLYPLVVGLDASFSGSGRFAAELNDGLSAIIQVGVAANFTGGGNMTAGTEGGASYPDGLSATVVPRYSTTAAFSGGGTLAGFSGVASAAQVDWAGNGALTVTLSQRCYVTTALGGDGELTATASAVASEETFADFTGDGELAADIAVYSYLLLAALNGRGTLTATQYAAYQRLTALLGNGSLSADTYIRYLSALGVSGAGALVAAMIANYQQTPATGGDGTIAATVSQKYPMTVNFTGGGALGASEFRNSASIDGLSATVYGYLVLWSMFTGGGALSAAVMAKASSAAAITGSGTLSATAVAQLPQSATLAGTGTLSATVFAKYPQAGNLLSTGQLMATTEAIMFTPFSETNTPRTNEPLPVSDAFKGIWATLIGAGAGGNGGQVNSGSANHAGGGGGGGGAFVPRLWIPKASLGSTYSVVVGVGGNGSGTASAIGAAGSATTFVSGSTNISAGGGGVGASYTAAGPGGTVSGTAGVAGTNGGAGVSSGVGGPGVNGLASNSGGAGAGAGGGVNVLGSRYAGGKGGDANGQAGGTTVAAPGTANPGSLPVAGVAGSGGGGGTSDGSNGGDGRGYGSGGGGSSAFHVTGTDRGGNGGPGYSKLEFTDTAPVAPVFNSVGAGDTGIGVVTSYSWLHNIPAGTDAIVVFTMHHGNGQNESATCGGVPMTQAARFQYYTDGFSAWFWHHAFTLLNPPSGNQTIAISGNVSGGATGNSVAYDNVSGFGAAVTKTGPSATALSLAVPSNNIQMVAQSFAHGAINFTAYNKTQRYLKNYAAGDSWALIIGDALGDPALNFTVTSSAATTYGAIGIPLIGT